MKYQIQLLIYTICLIYSTTCVKIGFPDNFNFTIQNGFRKQNFTNLLDHFSPGDSRTFQQRFWYSTEYFDQSSGPIFIYICGEYECRVRSDRLFPLEVSKEHKSIFFYLEHRYYGKSQPFTSHATPNLKWLTSRHALADLAVFITLLKEKLKVDFDNIERKVIVVGGSYPGAMAAWFKAKYPHLANAAWASSAVVNAIDNFNMFDYQIYNSTMRSNQTCTKVIQSITTFYDQLIDQKKYIELEALKMLFGTIIANNSDFAFFLADLFVGPVQYGNRTALCSFLQSIENLSISDKFAKLAEYTKGSHSPTSYDRDSLRNEEIVPSKSSRQWTYQYCTEFGYFQTPYNNLNMRSKLLTYSFWTDYCTYIFGEGISLKSNDTNAEYGSVNQTNGGEDPWLWAGVKSVKSNLNNVAITVQCENCAHCVDLYNSKDSDSNELKETRRMIKQWIRIIINGYFE